MVGEVGRQAQQVYRMPCSCCSSHREIRSRPSSSGDSDLSKSFVQSVRESTTGEDVETRKLQQLYTCPSVPQWYLHCGTALRAVSRDVEMARFPSLFQPMASAGKSAFSLVANLFLDESCRRLYNWLLQCPGDHLDLRCGCMAAWCSCLRARGGLFSPVAVGEKMFQAGLCLCLLGLTIPPWRRSCIVDKCNGDPLATSSALVDAQGAKTSVAMRPPADTSFAPE